jgi:hypothetical protein
MQFVLAILPYVLQLLCIIHIIRNGKNTFWIYILIFVPYVGGIVYLIVEILPSLGKKGSISSITDIVVTKIIPTYKLKELESKLALSQSFENKRNLADEYVNCGYFDKAITLYDSILVGIDKNNSDILLSKAKALYGNHNYQEAYSQLTKIDGNGFEYKKESELLIKLKIMEHIKPKEEVILLYKDAKTRFNSFEIIYYYIDYMITQNDMTEARSAIKEIEDIKNQLNRNKVTYQKMWVRKALLLKLKIKS